VRVWEPKKCQSWAPGTTHTEAGGRAQEPMGDQLWLNCCSTLGGGMGPAKPPLAPLCAPRAIWEATGAAQSYQCGPAVLSLLGLWGHFVGGEHAWCKPACWGACLVHTNKPPWPSLGGSPWRGAWCTTHHAGEAGQGGLCTKVGWSSSKPSDALIGLCGPTRLP